ncbi:MAG TPA: hypothetical protein VK131_01060 [Candidatus Acidoferrales bacterium]|nr:hypothetical protein [Candidatus Acidoferrales bacterium]
MITSEKSARTAAPPSEPPPPPVAANWWERWPPRPPRPRPISRRTVLLGGAVAVPFLAFVDGMLGVFAWYASGSVPIGLAVGGGLFAFTLLEFAVVAWAARWKQFR